MTTQKSPKTPNLIGRAKNFSETERLALVNGVKKDKKWYLSDPVKFAFFFQQLIHIAVKAYLFFSGANNNVGDFF